MKARAELEAKRDLLKSELLSSDEFKELQEKMKRDAATLKKSIENKNTIEKGNYETAKRRITPVEDLVRQLQLQRLSRLIRERMAESERKAIEQRQQERELELETEEAEAKEAAAAPRAAKFEKRGTDESKG